MNLRKLFAVLLTAIMCIMILPFEASAATKGVKLNKTSATMTVGDTLTLTRTVTGFKKCTLQWSSSDKTVATVSKGTITAKKAGTATITVKIKDTNYKATCKITVKAKSSSKSTSNTSSKSNNTTVTSAKNIVDKITVGWNLGNTFDCAGCTWLANDMDYETGWGNPKTTKAMISAVKKAGFNTIRIPVSWGDHMDENGKINSKWMDRVQEVVDYAYDNNMYIILNTHHDESWIKFDESNSAASIKKFTYVWKQIAAKFKDYDQHLIFEGLNEPRTIGSAREWNGGTSAEWEVLNKFYASFVKTVRDSGGNNKTRLLILTPYGASSVYSSMAALEIPDDDMIAVSVHAYTPYNMALNKDSSEKSLTDNGKKEIDGVFSNIDKVFLSKKIPVIMDECGALNKSNTKERAEWAKYYLSVAKKYGVPCCLWDDGGDFKLLNRNNIEWYYPAIIQAIIDTVK